MNTKSLYYVTVELTRYNSRTGNPYTIHCEVICVAAEEPPTWEDPGHPAEFEIEAQGSLGQYIELSPSEQEDAIALALNG